MGSLSGARGPSALNRGARDAVRGSLPTLEHRVPHLQRLCPGPLLACSPYRCNKGRAQFAGSLDRMEDLVSFEVPVPADAQVRE